MSWSESVTSRVSEKEIADAKSYLTGVFPIRLETQEGLTDQLVQIKMLNMPDDYLEHYRESVQAVTGDEILRVAKKYVKPDEAALIVVGDGAFVLEQMKPYCEDIEVYNTAGKRKTVQASGATDPVGSWSIQVETPLGQNIPAMLTISRTDSGYSGVIHSEMGDAELGAIEMNNNSFHTTTSLEMDGHAVQAEISGRFDGEHTEGFLKLQDSPELPFTGTKNKGHIRPTDLLLSIFLPKIKAPGMADMPGESQEEPSVMVIAIVATIR